MIRLFFGVPGSGKTLAMQDIVNLEIYNGNACAIVDMAREWDPSPSNARWRGNPPELQIASPPGAKSNALTQLQGVRDNGGGLLFQFPWEPLDVAELVRRVGDVTYVDDEIDKAALNISAWKDNPLRDFVHRGRHLPDAQGVPRQIHVLGAARRVQNLHTDLTSMADEVMMFRCQGKHTIKRLVDEGMIEEEDIAHVRSMPNLTYMLWKSSGQISRGHLKPI